MRFARPILSAAALLALAAFAAPASAQTQAASGARNSDNPMSMGIGFGSQQVDDATLEKRKEIERAYKDATRNTPAQANAVNDPWANMRGGDEPKPAAKPAAKTAQKKTKTH